jgi:HAD superfamily hydrolase (TIGR01549 family)
MVLTTVFFDFGGTLAYSPTVDRPARVWVDVARDFDLNLSEVLAGQALEVVNEEIGNQIYQYVGRTQEFWHRYDELVMDRLRIREHREELGRAVDARFEDPANVELYPETLSVLESLRSDGYHLGLISNYHDGLLKILGYHGLDKLLETVTYSQEVGAEKPDPRVFAKALERARCGPSDALYVGNSLQHDVEGARRSGLQAVWLDRNQEATPVECVTIHTLQELPHVLDMIKGADAPQT